MVREESISDDEALDVAIRSQVEALVGPASGEVAGNPESPEGAAVNNAVGALEVRADADPLASAKWYQKAIKSFGFGKDGTGRKISVDVGKVAGGAVVGGGYIGLLIVAKFLKGVFNFATEAAKGKPMSFSGGAKIGGDAMTFKEKKEK